MSATVSFRNACQSRKTLVGVVGLGYVGLPLVRVFSDSGFTCLGFDLDEEKVDSLNRGKSYISHVRDSEIKTWVERVGFSATSDMSRLSEADAILICVPTPLGESREPDLSFVLQTTQAIAACLRSGQLVVLESTTYPGTTRDLMLPILKSSGLTCGQDFFLAYSPEREDPGNASFGAKNTPKVVGGLDSVSLDTALALYREVISSLVPVSSVEIAEACKILENTYRGVNIAMVNELKLVFDRLGIDIWEVIDAAKTKPFGFQAFYPGPGLGGHCIPIDPFYLSWLARKNGMTARFIELSGEINTGMPQYVVDKIGRALNDRLKPIRGSRIGIFGIAYKPDVDDPRESPSFRLLELLGVRGAELSYVDPHVPVLPDMRAYTVPALTSEDPTREYLQSLDCAVIATAHNCFDYESIVRHCEIVVDTRNATSRVFNSNNVVKA